MPLHTGARQGPPIETLHMMTVPGGPRQLRADQNVALHAGCYYSGCPRHLRHGAWPGGAGSGHAQQYLYPSACVVRDHEGTTRPRFGLNIARSAAEGIIISQGPGARQVAHKMEEPPRMRVRRYDERSRRIRRRKAGRSREQKP